MNFQVLIPKLATLEIDSSESEMKTNLLFGNVIKLFSVEAAGIIVFGFILILTADWSDFIKDSPTFKLIQELLGRQ